MGRNKPKKKLQIIHDPNEKLYDCFPKAFVRFHYPDNDFTWALGHAVNIVLERMLWGRIKIEKDYFADKLPILRRAFVVAMNAMVHLQTTIREDGYWELAGFHDLCESANVEFIDDFMYYQEHMDSGGDSIYLDCYSGKLF